MEYKTRMPTRIPMRASHASSTLPTNGELSRLITAAVVNQKFCNLLLTNPATALATGYGGESFYLTTEEQELILSIQATTLADFATQLADRRNGNSNGNGYHGGNRHHSGNGVGTKAWGFE
jgi:hypothetical protein